MQPQPSRNSQIDWLLSGLRWLLLFSVLAIVLLGSGKASELGRQSLLLLAGAAVYNLAIMILLIFDRPISWLPLTSLAIDALLAVAFLFISGGSNSPLLFFSLFPILIAALRFDWLISLLTTVGLVGAYLLLGGALPEVLMLTLTAIFTTAINARVRNIVSDTRRGEESNELRRLRSSREQARAIFEMASTLSATLNYQHILDSVLDVSVLGLKEIGPSSTSLVSAVLLFSSVGLNVAASRHFTTRDQRLILTLSDGAISDALAKAEPILCDNPIDDPELTLFTALHRCQTVAIVPLRAGFENLGAAIFGSSEARVFTPEHLDLLLAVCNQATIALQNAQLFESLRTEKARIVEIEEDARKKLARDLHDGPTQSVAAIAMRLNYTRNLFKRDTSLVPEELEKLEELARNTTKEIRHMLFTLRPLVLETQGLRAALETLVQKLHDTDPLLNVQLKLDNHFENLDKDASGMIFYVVEEAVGNARKHSQAKNVWIQSRVEPDAYIIEVKDDGIGFDVAAVQSTYDKRGSLGMLNMSERSEVMSAKLSIASAIGQGTRVSMRLPLSRIQQ
jgi:signal transduction histidine kinase